MRFTEPAPGIFGRFIHYRTGVAFAQAVKYSENSSARLRIPHGISQWVYAPISLAHGIGLLELLGNPNNTSL
jgi:hypothetical protein